MTTFILVHGAWYGPWAWDRVVPLLHDAGVRTVTPALTMDGDVGLHTHAEEIAAVLETERDGGDVVLVAHSYAGLVVRQAADLYPGLVSHLVMVDGWAGADGASLFSLAPDSFVTAMRSAAESNLDKRQIPAPAPERFGISDPDDAEWLRARLRPQPLRTFTESTKLSGAVDRIPGTGIYCRPLTFAFDRFAEAIGYPAVALDGPHDVMRTHPEPLARLLLEPVGLA